MSSRVTGRVAWKSVYVLLDTVKFLLAVLRASVRRQVWRI
jgi:hypothetical protein